MATIRLSILHMDDSWSYNLLEQTLHYHCQVGGFKCGLSACYSVSPFLCQTAMNCHYCILINIPAELLWGRQITSCLAIRWECPFCSRQAHGFVPDGLGCHSVLHPSIHSAAFVCPLHLQYPQDIAITLEKLQHC